MLLVTPMWLSRGLQAYKEIVHSVREKIRENGRSHLSLQEWRKMATPNF